MSRRPHHTLILLGITMAFGLPSMAQNLPSPGDLAVSPQRIIFSQRTRTHELHLTNLGNQTTTYRVSFQSLAMTEGGRVREVTDLLNSAAPLLRCSPRQIELAPGERQVVRVMLRKPESLKEGEYRIHVLFQAVPPPESVPLQESPHHNQMNIQLVAIPGISIPALVRHGQMTPGFALSSVEAHPDRVVLVTEMTGNQTLYGELTLYHRASANHREQELGRIQGYAHYADLPRLRMEIPTKMKESIHQGVFRAVLRDEDGREVATATLALPP